MDNTDNSKSLIISLVCHGEELYWLDTADFFEEIGKMIFLILCVEYLMVFLAIIIIIIFWLRRRLCNAGGKDLGQNFSTDIFSFLYYIEKNIKSEGVNLWDLFIKLKI